MADGSGPGRVTLSGIALAGLLLILILASLYFFIAQPYWFPVLASEHGGLIDSLFGTVLVVTGIAFVLVQGALGLFIARYGANGNERAAYWHDNPKVEAVLLITTAVILTVLVFMGQRVWASVYFSDQPQNATIIQITGEQFLWNFHYPGADGQFGRTDTKLITSTNNIGLDRNDPIAKDDVAAKRLQDFPVALLLDSISFPAEGDQCVQKHPGNENTIQIADGLDVRRIYFLKVKAECMQVVS